MDSLELDLHLPALVIQRESMRLGVQFFKKNNRFGHVVSFGREDQLYKLVSYCEEETEWPRNPPIQDVHFEDRDQSRVLLGVGMAGRSHYSISIRSDLTTTLEFEFACHIKSRAEFLGTQYFLADNGSSVHRQQLPGRESLARHFRARAGSQLNLADNLEPSNLEASLRLLPEVMPNSFPATVEWGLTARI